MRAFLQQHTFAATMFAASVFIGMETGGYQYIVLKVAEEYGLSQSRMGFLISMHFIAATIMPPLIGPLSDRIGKKKTTILGCLFYLAGAVVCCFVHSPMGFAAGIFGAGAAFGSLLTTCQAALSDAHPGEGGKYVSLFQGTLGIGCVVIPLGADVQKKEEDQGAAGRGLFSGLASVFLVGTLIGILLYMFCETTLTFFMDSYFTLVFEDPSRSAIALALFWAGLAMIRLLASRFYRYAYILVPVLMLSSAAVMALFALNQSPIVAAGLAGIAGVLFGPIWPFLLGIATDRYPERTGTVTGLVMLMDGSGGALAPVLIGLLSDLAGLRFAFGLVGIFLTISAAVFVFMVSGVRSRRREVI